MRLLVSITAALLCSGITFIKADFFDASCRGLWTFLLFVLHLLSEMTRPKSKWIVFLSIDTSLLPSLSVSLSQHVSLPPLFVPVWNHLSICLLLNHEMQISTEYKNVLKLLSFITHKTRPLSIIFSHSLTHTQTPPIVCHRHTIGAVCVWWSLL